MKINEFENLEKMWKNEMFALENLIQDIKNLITEIPNGEKNTKNEYYRLLCGTIRYHTYRIDQLKDSLRYVETEDCKSLEYCIG